MFIGAKLDPIAFHRRETFRGFAPMEKAGRVPQSINI